MVQIFERSAIASSRRLTTAIAEGWMGASIKTGKGTMESIMRKAIKILRIRNEIIDLSYLGDDQLEMTIVTVFESAMPVVSR
jgi:hypothetical protein